MKILVVNAGSSSLKYQLFDMDTQNVIAKGVCERIGMADGIVSHSAEGKESYKATVNMENHIVAFEKVVELLLSKEYGCISSMDEINAVGHRIVHGGKYFSKAVLVDDEVMEKLNKCIDIAPLHTPPHIMGIESCQKVMHNIPQVLVFDTAFHQTMPEKAYLYAIASDVAEKYSIRRYGFHGSSHKYVSQKCIQLLNKEHSNIVTCHLGNGSSITAVKDGKCIDTSMGFTPLDGVVMGTRCGSIDPAIVTFVMEKEGFTPSQMNNYMNKACGFLGVSQVSSDCRDIEGKYNEGDPKSTAVLELLCYQIQKYIGSYTAAMGGLDAIVFTAGIGENTPFIRKKVCDALGYFGVEIDHTANEYKAKGNPDIVEISTPNSKVKVYIIPTNEELVIAEDTQAVVAAL